MAQKGCLILYGEAFREDKQFDRNRDTTQGFENQMKACDSHVKFIERMKSKHIDMDVSISTYCTKYEKELKEKYANCNLFYSCETEMMEDIIKSIDNIVSKSIQNIQLDNYSFILLTRNDICFKDEFIDTFEPSERILFVSQQWTHHDCLKDDTSYPVVNSIIMYIPKYFLITKKFHIDHDAWKHYIQKYKLKNQDMGFMLNTYHDADTYKDNNPLYYMVGRPQTNEWYDKDKVNKNDWDNNDISCYSYKNILG